MQRLGRNGKIRVALGDRLAQLSRGALVHVQRYLGVTLDKRTDHLRQGIASLGVGRRYVQRPLLRVGELPGDRLDAFNFGQYFLRNLQNIASCRRDLR